MIFFFVSTFLLAFLVQASAFAYRHPEHLQAIARIRSADGKIKGQIEFVQQFKRGAPTHIFGNFSGLSKGAHGIGIMDYGNMLKRCESMGAEFNPDRMRHRARQGNAIHRVGALGNVRDGEYNDQFNQQVSLFGRNSVFGRGVVVFENSDDGSGRADAFQSERNGNVGRSIACGIIGRMGGNFV